MIFSVQDLSVAFDSVYFQRGQSYLKRGMVKELDILTDNSGIVCFESSVMGSGLQLYKQDIFINKTKNGVNVTGYCSCPVYSKCKHMAAACLQYQADYSGKPVVPDAMLWLNDFSESLETSGIGMATTGDFLVYVLKRQSSSQNIEVVFHKVRLLKKGGLSKGKEITFRNLPDLSYYTPDYIEENDREVISLLNAVNEIYGSICLLQGITGLFALQRMVSSGRCFLESHQAFPPLTWGEARSCEQQWIYDDQGNAKLAFQIQPDAVWMFTEPATYLDVKNNEAGILDDMPYTTKQLKQLAAAPVVPAALLQDFSQRIATSLPKAILAPPTTVDMEELGNEKPVPKLFLHMDERVTGGFRLARMRFDYAGHEISFLPEDEQRTFTSGHKIISVVRDKAEEEELLMQMQSLGLTGGGGFDHNDADVYFFFKPEHDLESDSLWANFLSQDVPKLEAEGWHIEVADNFNMLIHEADDWHADIEEQGSEWFDLRFDVEINGQKQALLPLIAQVLKFYEPEHLPETLTLNLGDGQYLKLPREQIKPVLDVLYELYDHESLSDDGSLSMSRFDAGRLADLEQNNANLQWRGGENLREIGKQLQDFAGIEAVAPPQGLKAELRQYQQQGLNWLQFLRQYQFNGILADDMGLGKTVQTLAHLLLEKEQGRMQQPCLIVAPTSLMSNWRREAAVFAPALKVLVLQGSERSQFFEHIAEYDIVLSTYPLLVRDEEVLMKHDFHLLVLDEAQVVKNPKAKAAKVIRKLNATHKLCLTGTPMENHLGELWALFDFLMPGFLGNSKQFNSVFRTPIEKHGNPEQQQRLVQRIKPFMLRRAKSEVASELPEKTEIIRTVSLDKKQASLYETIRISMEKKVRDTIASKGLARSHIMILDALLKLRQVCCDPRILSLKQASKLEESAKLELLMQMLPEMVEEGRRILLFSQFTKMLGLIEDELKSRKISYSKLTGQTRKRDDAIEKFKQGEADVFLISLKAGGVGLNLTEADTVIHYDPWWNPAAENQATDRAHRIGQEKAVFVYKLVVENSVEEKIVAMQAKKQALADAVYQSGKKQNELKITADDMQDLFAPL